MTVTGETAKQGPCGTRTKACARHPSGQGRSPARYDLVSGQYLHLPPESREALLRGLAGAVAPGGTLLIVGHHSSDSQTTMPRPPMPEPPAPTRTGVPS